MEKHNAQYHKTLQLNYYTLLRYYYYYHTTPHHHTTLHHFTAILSRKILMFFVLSLLFKCCRVKSSNTVDTICITLEDYCQDFVHLRDLYYDTLLARAQSRVAREYYRALFAKSVIAAPFWVTRCSPLETTVVLSGCKIEV